MDVTVEIMLQEYVTNKIINFNAVSIREMTVSVV
jgi:hypothetical protein